jgi:cation transport regulator ChaC
MKSDVWVFGYGSLVWRPAFAYRERRPAVVEGYVRRFWQGSTDHRGIPGAPGRVVTLVDEPGGRCHGMAYRIAVEQREAVLGGLDHRERGGYERESVNLDFGGGTSLQGALLYRATSRNPNYLGPAPLREIARQVHTACGPSGSNREYVFRLAEALRTMQAPDPHVQAVAELLQEL